MLQVTVCAQVIANSESEAIEQLENESREFQLNYEYDSDDSGVKSVDSYEANFKEINIKYSEKI